MNQELLIKYIDGTKGISRKSEVATSNKDGLTVHICLVELSVLKQQVPARLVITDRFPRILPAFNIERYDLLGFIPHIEPNGRICFFEHKSESVYINEEVPELVFDQSVRMTIETLENGLKGENVSDFREEFHLFWERNQHRGKLLLGSQIEVNDVPRKISLVKDMNIALVSEVGITSTRYKNALLKGTQLASKSGIYIPLTNVETILPPKYDEKWNALDFVQWVRPKISHDHWEIMKSKILNKNSKALKYVLFSVPRTTGPTLLMGGRFEPKKQSIHPLLSPNSDWNFKFLTVIRFDNQAILPRGGAIHELMNKKVLIVGCGSVGSHLALDLVKAGFARLTIVDPDNIEQGNLYRFALGQEYMDQNKSSAMAVYIEKNYLSVKVVAKKYNIRDLLRSESIKLAEYELVISATGAPTTDLHLNKIAIEQDVPFINGWNDPYSLGGHAVLHSPKESGCYKCLFDDEGYNTASFTSKEQPRPFHKKHLGCGEVFTPYTALDSTKTAEIMTQLAISYFTKENVPSEILSWKGESDAFTEEGFSLSSRYLNQTIDDLKARRFAFFNPECPHCLTVESVRNDS